MAKKQYFRNLSSSSINLANFSVYKINKDKTIIYRCKFCLKGKIKKINNKFIRFSGHKHNCSFNNKILGKKNILKKNSVEKANNTFLINDKKKLKNDSNSNNDINLFKKNEDIINYNFPDNIAYQNNNNKNNKKYKNTKHLKIKHKNILSFPKKILEAPSNIEILCNEINNVYKSSISPKFKKYNLFNCFRLGSGSFGFCYFGISKERNIPCAIKISHEENLDELDKEAEFLEKFWDIDFFPKLISLEKDEDLSPYIAEDLMGPTLRKLYNFCENKIDVKSLCNIGIDLISCLHAIHRKEILHGDIKLSNICWNIINNISINPDLVLIDYGYCTYIKDIKNNKKKGNDYYKAVEIIEGIKISKKMEMFVIMYILYQLYTGSLPWKKEKKDNENKKQKIFNIKPDFNFVKDLPQEIKEIGKIYAEIKGLEYSDEPEYIKYQSILNNIIENQTNNNYNNIRFLWEQKIILLFKEAQKYKNPQNVKEKVYNSLFDGYPKQFINYILKKKYL